MKRKNGKTKKVMNERNKKARKKGKKTIERKE